MNLNPVCVCVCVSERAQLLDVRKSRTRASLAYRTFGQVFGDVIGHALQHLLVMYKGPSDAM